MRTIENENGPVEIIIEPGEELLVRNAYTGALIRTVQNKGAQAVHFMTHPSEVYAAKKIAYEKAPLYPEYTGGKEL